METVVVVFLILASITLVVPAFFSLLLLLAFIYGMAAQFVQGFKEGRRGRGPK